MVRTAAALLASLALAVTGASASDGETAGENSTAQSICLMIEAAARRATACRSNSSPA